MTMKKFKKIIGVILGGLFVAGTALAINITVPSAPGSNYVLLSTSTGAYIPVATSSLGITGGGSATTTINGVLGPIFTFIASSTASTSALLVISTTTGTILINAPFNLYLSTTSAAANYVSTSTLSSTLTGYLSTTSAASTYYLQTNPANYITLSSLTGDSPITYNIGTGHIGFSNPGYITLSSLSATAPIKYNSGTGAISTDFSTSSVNVFTNLNTFNATTTLATTTVSQLSTTGGIVKRTVGYTASTTITINSATTDIATTSLIYSTTTFANPSGTALDSQSFAIKAYATTTRGLAWGANFASTSALTLPISQATGTMWYGFTYDAGLSKWCLMATQGPF